MKLIACIYSKDKKIMKISIYVFWFKYEKNLKSVINKALLKNYDEPILYNIIDEIKNKVESSLANK